MRVSVSALLRGENKDKEKEFVETTPWLFCESFEELKSQCKVSCDINDKGDVCLRLQAANPDGRIIYYFESGELNDSANKLPDLGNYRRQTTAVR